MKNYNLPITGYRIYLYTSAGGNYGLTNRVIFPSTNRSIRVAKWLALLTSDHKVQGLTPAEGRIQLMTVEHIIVQNLSLSFFCCLDMM